MDGLFLTVGFLLQALSVIWIIFYIRDRRTVEIRELEGERDELMDQLYVYPLREYKEDFLPKYKMRYHTLVEPIAYYSENECGSATFCNNCYDTTDYDSL
jgi:hypothetical protein